MNASAFTDLPEQPAVAPMPAPEVARRILASRFSVFAEPPAGPTAFNLTDFQAEAVAVAGVILEQWGGVLVADSVGLGKTYIGLALLEQVMRGGGTGLVVVPAALRRAWRPGLERLRRTTGGRVPLVSHTQVALGSVPDPRNAMSDRILRTQPGRLVVVVDEAHAFRNRRTKRYRALATLCRHARVVLLTATPVNNSVMDLYALIRLFARDDTFRDLGVPALKAAFLAAARGAGARDHGEHPAGIPVRSTGAVQIDPIMPVVHAVVIRRTRAFVRDRYGAVRLPGAGARADNALTFPRRAPPHPVPYALFEDPEAFGLVARDLLAVCFTPLALARRPGLRVPRRDEATAGRPATRNGVAELMRLALLKRLESGFHPFRLSVERQLGYHEAFAEALGRGFLLPARLHRTLAGDGDALQLLLEPLALEPLPPWLDRDRTAADVADDIERLRSLRDRARPLVDDAKLNALRTLLGTLAGRKIVVFTEFRDTAAYLWRGLLATGVRAGRVDGAGAFLGHERAGRRVVIDRFAPRANGAPEPPARERVDVLVATDVLAEGLNLQDAAHVVSYDLPWNPVRLIQRVGRIDRLGSPHDVVYPHFLLPGPELDRLLGLHARIRAKLAAIGATVGLDGTVLDDDGTGTSVVERLVRGDPDVLDELERADTGPLPGWIPVAHAGSGRGSGKCAVPGEAGRVPCAALASPRSLVALEMDGAIFWFLVDADGARVDDDAAEEVLRAALDRQAPTAESDSAGPAPDPCAVALVLAAARAEAHRRRKPEPYPALQDAHSAGARAARWLRTLLAREGGRSLEPALADRVDEMLRRLARPLDAAAEGRIEDTLRTAGDDCDSRGGHADGNARANRLPRAVGLLEEALRGWEQNDLSDADGRQAIPRIRWIGALIGSPARRHAFDNEPGPAGTPHGRTVPDR